MQQEDFVRLDMSFFHSEKAGKLPDIHQDPFDRMLIAQAQAEGLEIVTDDLRIQQYGVKTLVAGV